MANEIPLPSLQEAPAAATGRGRTIALVVGIILVGGILLISLLGLRQANTPRPEVGRPAPSFSLPLFDGGHIALADLKGKPVVVNFWASWCVPCVDEAPQLEQAWRAYKERGVGFLGIDYVDTEPKAREFMEKHGITYPNGPDLGSRISQEYRIKGVPETFVIDKDGIVRFVKIGPTTADELRSVLEPLLR